MTRIRSVLLGAACLTLCVSTSANAAVLVFGTGPAKDCFNVAEFGGNAHEGVEFCDAALEGPLTSSDRAATLVNRGVIRLRDHDNERALADINAGIAIDSSLGDAYVDRGAASIALGHYDDALADLNKGLSLGPHSPQVAYYDRAIIYERNGDVRAAYEDYKKALDIAPGFTPAADELKRFHVVRKSSGA